MSNITNKNTVSPISAAISGIMNDAAASNNKQAALVVGLFESEASFSNDVLLNMLRKEKAERTMSRENLIRSISDEYANACDMLKMLKEKDKNTRTEKEAFQMEGLNNKIRAANIMFERAAESVIGLRASNVKSIKTTNIGSGALVIKTPDPDGEEGEYINHKSSCAAVHSAAKKTVNKLLGKEKKQAEDAAANPMKTGMLGTISAVNRFLEISMKDTSKPVAAFADFADDLEKQLNELFDRMFVLKFGQPDHMTHNDVADYINEAYPTAAVKPVKKAG